MAHLSGSQKKITQMALADQKFPEVFTQVNLLLPVATSHLKEEPTSNWSKTGGLVVCIPAEKIRSDEFHVMDFFRHLCMCFLMLEIKYL